jgi:hypothetical protein
MSASSSHQVGVVINLIAELPVIAVSAKVARFLSAEALTSLKVETICTLSLARMARDDQLRLLRVIPRVKVASRGTLEGFMCQ